MNPTYIATVDLDVSARDLAESWVNGNLKYVIDKLENDHPGLAALLLVQHGPVNDGVLSESDCNAIANRLIERRRELCL